MRRKEFQVIEFSLPGVYNERIIQDRPVKKSRLIEEYSNNFPKFFQ